MKIVSMAISKTEVKHPTTSDDRTPAKINGIQTEVRVALWNDFKMFKNATKVQLINYYHYKVSEENGNKNNADSRKPKQSIAKRVECHHFHDISH